MLTTIDVSAYWERDNFYPFNSNDMRFRLIGTSSTFYDQTVDSMQDGQLGYFYLFGNSDTSNIQKVAFTTNKITSLWTFPFSPDVYDYYFVGALYAPCNDTSKSTFFPGQLRMFGYDANAYDVIEYDLSDVRFYDFDMDNIRGFSWSAKVDFAGAGCSSIRGWEFLMSGSALGSKPADQQLECGILQVLKGSSQIQVDDAITDAITASSENIVSSIENQYFVDAGEDLGIDSMVGQVEENLGVLGFTSDVFLDIIGLFDPDLAKSKGTTITFPSFSLPMGTSTVKIWDAYVFDFAVLESRFSFIITAMRSITVMAFYLFVLKNVELTFKFIIGINSEGGS